MSCEDDVSWDDDLSTPVATGDPNKLVDDEASVERDKNKQGAESEPDDDEDSEAGDDMDDFLKDEDSSSEEEPDDDDQEDEKEVENESGNEEGDDEAEEEEDEGTTDKVEEGSNALKRLMQSSKERPSKKQKYKKSEFIEDEAELSGDDEVSDDELEQSDDDQIDPEVVDQDAKDLSSEEEEEVRRLYQKQLEAEDKRAVLVLQEQLEENEIDLGQRRRRKFKWQTRDIMENSLKRHYDPDDDDSEGSGLDVDEQMIEFSEIRLRRPTAESILLGNTKLRCTRVPHADYDDEDMFSDDGEGEEEEDDDDDDDDEDDEDGDGSPIVLRRNKHNKSTGVASGVASNDDSNSLFMHTIPSTSTGGGGGGGGGGADGNLNKYVYRDKELVQALSTKEVIVNTREEKERIIQRELKKVAQSKSIFDQLY